MGFWAEQKLEKNENGNANARPASHQESRNSSCVKPIVRCQKRDEGERNRKKRSLPLQKWKEIQELLHALRSRLARFLLVGRAEVFQQGRLKYARPHCPRR